MLFAGCERQHKAASSILVVGFADQSARNLSRKFIARGKQTDVWTTVRQRYAERLTFSDNDVCAASTRRTQEPERNCLGDCDNQQCARGVRFLGKCRNI